MKEKQHIINITKQMGNNKKKIRDGCCPNRQEMYQNTSQNYKHQSTKSPGGTSRGIPRHLGHREAQPPKSTLFPQICCQA